MKARERVRERPYAWKKAWKKCASTMDSNDQAYGPKLNIADFQIVNELSYLMRFLPMTYQ